MGANQKGKAALHLAFRGRGGSVFTRPAPPPKPAPPPNAPPYPFLPPHSPSSPPHTPSSPPQPAGSSSAAARRPLASRGRGFGGRAEGLGWEGGRGRGVRVWGAWRVSRGGCLRAPASSFKGRPATRAPRASACAFGALGAATAAPLYAASPLPLRAPASPPSSTAPTRASPHTTPTPSRVAAVVGAALHEQQAYPRPPPPQNTPPLNQPTPPHVSLPSLAQYSTNRRSISGST